MIPSGWSRLTLGELITLEYGKSLPENSRASGSTSVIGSSGKIGNHNECLIPGPAIVIGRKGTVGNIIWSTQNCWPIDTTYYVTKKTSCDLKFVFFLLKLITLKKLAEGTGVPGLNRDRVYSQAAEIPPLWVQKRIAEILTSVDDAIQATQKVIEQTQRLKQGLMQELLTRGIGHTKFKMTEIGSIPVEWGVQMIGTFAKSISLRNMESAPVPVLSMTKHRGFVKSTEYFGKQIFSKNTANYKIVNRGEFAYATIHLDEGSIDFLSEFNIGQVSPMYTVFRVDDTIVERYWLKTVLKSDRLLDVYGGVGQGSINRRKSITFDIFSSIKIAIPPLTEQKRIAEILGAVDDEILALQKSRDQQERVKQGLMQDLLSGRVRVLPEKEIVEQEIHFDLAEVKKIDSNPVQLEAYA